MNPNGESTLPTELQASSAGQEPIISVHDLGKMYRLYNQPVDRLKQSLFWRFGRSYGHEFWALRGVSLDILPGESVGIIGRNGSGKSTLLQLLAGTLQPTTGTFSARGKIAALLELGSGFNPEYTGRENVFLNGAILGFSYSEMAQRLDDIISFADIGEFIDQPIKSYSSGMFARLAFSVAISVDPDILIVDEILAVGDYGFQQKCVARLRQMRDRGLTLLFVSHSPDTIKSVCTKGLFLINGQPEYWGAAEQAVDLYFRHVRCQSNADALQAEQDLRAMPVEEKAPDTAGLPRYGTGHAKIAHVEVLNDAREPHRAFQLGEYVTLSVTFDSEATLDNVSVSFLIRDLAGIDLAGTTTFDEHGATLPMKAGDRRTIRFRFRNVFQAGNLGFSVALNRITQRDYSDNLLLDQIDAAAYFVSIPSPNRPVYYKFHLPIEIDVSSSRG